ncbi:MAG: serpin family protein [Bacteroidales bacterium]|nr:serpin family protein [Bacteroidales bacterium]
MKNYNIALTFFVLFISTIFSGCEKQPNDNPEEKQTSTLDLTKTELTLLESNNEFGLTLFQTLFNETSKEKNIFISPLSVAYALAMTYNGANGSTKEAMENTLKLAGLTTEEINSSFKNLMHILLNLDKDVLFDIANSIWYRDCFYVEPDFISVNEEYYNAEVSALDFSSPDAVTTINKWVANKTHDKITEIINSIPPDVVMYLINAIYFKGTWTYEFDETQTIERNFYSEEEPYATCSTMVQQSNFYYTENDLFEAAELPYGNEDFAMVILLPKSPNRVKDIVDAANNESWNAWMDGFDEKIELKVYLPKILLKYDTLLNGPLSDMGMGVAFSPSADFTNINHEGNLYISRVIHKSFLEVNEEGTEAAAVTAVEVGYTSIGDDTPSYKLFNVDRPFVLAIRERSTNTILFIGSIYTPVE